MGWGGLPDVFDEKKTSWSEEYNTLKGLLSTEEYESARASTLTAFYTPPVVISAIYQALQNMGTRTSKHFRAKLWYRQFFRHVAKSITKF